MDIDVLEMEPNNVTCQQVGRLKGFNSEGNKDISSLFNRRLVIKISEACQLMGKEANYQNIHYYK